MPMKIVIVLDVPIAEISMISEKPYSMQTTSVLHKRTHCLNDLNKIIINEGVYKVPDNLIFFSHPSFNLFAKTFKKNIFLFLFFTEIFFPHPW